MPTGIHIRLRAIVPRDKVLDINALERNLLGALDHSTNIFLQDFRATTRTWKHRVVFHQVRARRRGGDLAGAAGTNDRIYRYVVRGTKPRLIRARKGGYLVFQTGFKAKTRPGILGSSGGRSFGPTAFARQVRHPGIKARNFDREIEKRRVHNVRQLVVVAFSKSLRNPGSRTIG